MDERDFEQEARDRQLEKAPPPVGPSDRSGMEPDEDPTSESKGSDA